MRAQPHEEAPRARARARPGRSASGSAPSPPGAAAGRAGRCPRRTRRGASAWRGTRAGTSGRSGTSRRARRRGWPWSVNTSSEFSIRPAKLAAPLGQRLEHLAAVADQPLHGELLAVEHAQRVVGLLGERVEACDREREVVAAALAAPRPGPASRPGTRHACARRRRGRSRRAGPRRRPAPPGGCRPRESSPTAAASSRSARRATRPSPGSARRRSRRAASSACRMAWVSVGSGAYAAWISSSASAMPVVAELDRLHLSDRYTRDTHVGLGREGRRLVERDRDPVALGLQRHRTAERDPEEQRQAEAGDREADGDQDAGGCRGLASAVSAGPGGRSSRSSGTRLSCWRVRM